MRKVGSGVSVLLAVSVLSILVIDLSAGTASAAPKELIIGALWGLSGPGSENMAACADGEKAGVDWINSKAWITVKGEKYLIKLVGEDDKMSPDGTVAATNKLVFDDKVKFMFGLAVPPFKFAAEPITGPNKVLRMDINVIGAPQELSANTPYTFAGIPTRAAYDPALDYFLQTYRQAKKVAVAAPDDPGARTVNQDLKPRLVKRNISVVAKNTIPSAQAITVRCGASCWPGNRTRF
jgi:branched-chain amino acid transport system substrate-binding protein